MGKSFTGRERRKHRGEDVAWHGEDSRSTPAPHASANSQPHGASHNRPHQSRLAVSAEDVEAGPTVFGAVKRMQKDKGFGFIRGDNGVEYFFHHTHCEPGEFETLFETQRVSLKPWKSGKGPRATDVKKLP